MRHYNIPDTHYIMMNDMMLMLNSDLEQSSDFL